MNKIINHIGLSSGKDSTALLIWVIFLSGYPLETIRITACDTENEYAEFYQQIAALNEICLKFGIAPIRILKSMGFLNLAVSKHRFPSARARFCTEELKIKPTRQYIQELWMEGYEVVLHLGVRADESTERSLLSEWGESYYCKVRRPILKWSIAEVWEAHRKYGFPINPLYAKGRKRVGCRLCCMSRKADIRLTATTEPTVIDEYREWEKAVGANSQSGFSGFFHRGTVPAAQRTKEIITREGEKMMVATIDDVARWSMTLRGGFQGGFEFMFEEDDAEAPCQMGYCE